jgi:hypothetical protein
MMKNLPGLCCGILAMAAVVSAQTPSATSSSASTITQQSGDTITVTGCVAPDVASNPSAASTTSHRFILSNLQSPPDRPNVDSRQSGVSAYVLTPNDDLNLGQHIGHKVEVTGFVDSMSAPAARSNAKGDNGSMPQFHATSVRMLSATCP